MIDLVELDAAEAGASAGQLAEVLVDCVEGGASVSFMAPLCRERAEAFWRQVAGGVAAGERRLFAARADGRIVGTVQLVPAGPENQPHRADIAKLLVLREMRGAGVGAALMGAAEHAARAAGLTLLMLDTTAGMSGDRLYQRLGWTRFGVVPGHALMPDGAMSDTAFFYTAL